MTGLTDELETYQLSSASYLAEHERYIGVICFKPPTQVTKSFLHLWACLFGDLASVEKPFIETIQLANEFQLCIEDRRKCCQSCLNVVKVWDVFVSILERHCAFKVDGERKVCLCRSAKIYWTDVVSLTSSQTSFSNRLTYNLQLCIRACIRDTWSESGWYAVCSISQVELNSFTRSLRVLESAVGKRRIHVLCIACGS